MLQGLHLNIPFIFAMLCAILHTKSRLSKLPQHVQCSAERVLSPCMHKWLPLQLPVRYMLAGHSVLHAVHLPLIY